MAYENPNPGADKRKRSRELDGSITLLWIARRLGTTEDEALGAVMLHRAGIEWHQEIASILSVAGMEGGGE